MRSFLFHTETIQDLEDLYHRKLTRLVQTDETDTVFRLSNHRHWKLSSGCYHKLEQAQRQFLVDRDVMQFLTVAQVTTKDTTDDLVSLDDAPPGQARYILRSRGELN